MSMVPRSIVREAEAFDADLLAVSTAGRSSVGRVVLGGVAEAVVRKTTVPVLLFRPSRSHP